MFVPKLHSIIYEKIASLIIFPFSANCIASLFLYFLYFLIRCKFWDLALYHL